MGARMKKAILVSLLFCSFAIAQVPTTVSDQPYSGEIAVAVDASAASSRLFHAKLTIPVKPGALTLLYPKWIPGEHGPTGPITDLTGLKISANGQPLAWRRDDIEMYAIHVNVPAGVNALDVALDYTSPVQEGIYTGGPTASDKLAVVSWNVLLLYPAGYRADKITYKASLKVPTGWQMGSPLPMAGQSGDTYEFKPASLYTLVDSPVITGANFKVLRLTGPSVSPVVQMDIAADSPDALRFPPETEQHLKNLPGEALALFGATHYRNYHFLFSLSNHVAHFGLEHHESNDTRVPERTMIDADYYRMMGGVIPHEYVHSWNGKFRRPAGLNTPDYEQPMKGEMLWVYEGMTEYLGDVLMARTGLWTPDRYRENLARLAGELDNRAGRTWRPLVDTAVSVQTLNYAPYAWSNWRRALDYYDEGELIWLEADMTIRQLTNGQKTFDDFTRAFYGQPSLGANEVPGPKPYTFDDVVNALNQVAPFDWRKFLVDRLTSTSPKAPLGGVEASGWRLIYTDQIPEGLRAKEELRKYTDVSFSIGLIIDEQDSTIEDSWFNKPAALVGITPGMKVIAINGRKYSPTILRTAIREAKGTQQSIELLVQNADFFKTYKLDYHDGEKYPLLQRNEKPDALTDVIRPHATK
jgi:predicted metalloprotease with PDZ domain